MRDWENHYPISRADVVTAASLQTVKLDNVHQMWATHKFNVILRVTMLTTNARQLEIHRISIWAPSIENSM